MSLVSRQWEKFCLMLNALNIESLEEKSFYAAISAWLMRNQNAFDENIWTSYGLGQLVELDPSLFKVECLEGFMSEHIGRLNNLRPSSQDSMAMIIRDVLWDMVAFKTKVECPNCHDDDLRALVEPKSGKIVLSCDLCCWSQTSCGNAWSGSQDLKPANKEQLVGLSVE